MNIFKQLFGSTNTPDLTNLIEQGALLVDLRTPSEFAGGSVKGSVNIPLDSITNKLSHFKSKTNIIVFCRSGMRSSQAKSILEQNGFNNVINGGSWDDVNSFVK